MAQLPNLDNAPIDLSSYRDHARKELVDALDSMRGKKVLVLDPKLSGPLALIVQIALLKEHGVENLYHLTSEPINTECKNVMYLVRPAPGLMKVIAGHVRHDNREKLQRQYSVYLMPRRTIACEKVLEDAGIFADVTLGEYPLDLIPFDEDVLSLELDLAYKELLVDGDRSCLYDMAKALWRLQAVFGTIPNIKGKGRAASHVAELMARMRREQPLPQISPEIDTLILLDRQVDMITPMCTQLTYEGLLDEFLHISNGAVEVDPTVMGQAANAKKLKIPLNSTDKLYRELRDLNFGVVGNILRQKATAMREDYKDLPQNQSVSQLKDFVKRLNILPEMTRHTNLAQHLSGFTTNPAFLSRLNIEQSMLEVRPEAPSEYIEEMIDKQEPLASVLRLLCLLSLTSGGLPRKQFDYLRREILQSYGYEYTFTLNNLEKAGLLRRQDGRNNHPSIRRALKLVVEGQDDSNPTDVSYTFSGYAPLSIRLIQQALQDKWKSMDELLRTLPGPHFEKTQALDADGAPVEHEAQTVSSDRPDGQRPLVLVVFLGGVTSAEISALRFLSSQEDAKHDFVVATTKLVTGTSLLETLIDDDWRLRNSR